MRKLMNTKAVIATLVLMTTVCLVPAMAGAVSPGSGEGCKEIDGKRQHRSPLGIWRNPPMVENLQLTDQQVNQLRDIDFAHREKQQALKAQLDSLRLQMDKAFTDDNVDKASVRQTAEKIADVKGSMFVERIDSRLAFEDILSAEQIDNLKQYRMNSRMKGKQQCQRQIKGRHWAQNQDYSRFSDNPSD